MEKLYITDLVRSVNIMSLDNTTIAQLKRSSWFDQLAYNLYEPRELRLRIQLSNATGTLNNLYQELKTLHELLWFANEFGKYRQGRPVYIQVQTENEDTEYYCLLLGCVNPDEASTVWSANENKFIESFELRLIRSPLWIYDTPIDYSTLPSTVVTAPGVITKAIGGVSEYIPSPTIFSVGIANGIDKPAYILIGNNDIRQPSVVNITSGSTGSAIANITALNNDIFSMTIGAGATAFARTVITDWTLYDADHSRVFVTVNTNRKVVLRAESIVSYNEGSGLRNTTYGKRTVVDDTGGQPIVVDLGVVTTHRFRNEPLRINVEITNIDTTSATFEIDLIAAIGEGPATTSSTSIGTVNSFQLPSSYVFFFPNGTRGGGIRLLFDPGMMKRNYNSQGAYIGDNDRPYAGIYYTLNDTANNLDWENNDLIQVINPILCHYPTAAIAWIQTGAATAWLPNSIPGVKSNVTVFGVRKPASLSPFREAR